MFPGWPTGDASDRESVDAVFWWLVRLRWMAVLGVVLVLGLTGPVLDVLPAGAARWLWTTAGGLLAYTAWLTVVGPHRGWRWLTRFTGQIAVDCVALATLVHFAGGIDNPFLPLFVLHVVNANIVLSRRAALGVLGFAIAVVTAVVLAEGTGLVEHHCLRLPSEFCAAGALDMRTLAVLGGLVLTLVTASLFTRVLTERLRAGRRRLSETVVELTAEKQRLAHTHAVIETERARWQAIIDCMGDAVIFLDPEGRPLFANQRARDLWRAGGSSSGLETLDEVLQEIAVAGAPCTFERGGRLFEATRSCVQNAQRQTLGLVMVIRDATDRLAMERHLMHEEQMSVVGKLAATVAHEINNPIGVVSLYSQDALAKLSPDSPVYRHVETIRRSAERCRTIVGGLLKLARRPQPQHQRVDLHRLCREVIDVVQPLAAPGGVQVSSGRRAGESPLWAQVDAGMLHQALLNLAVNAIEASVEGGVVSIDAYEAGHGSARAHVIEVRDTGMGIAPADVAQVFQPFFTTKATGTGLGLSVAQDIVASHDGRIEMESVMGTGTTFRIVLSDRLAGAAPPPGDARARVLAAEGPP